MTGVALDALAGELRSVLGQLVRRMRNEYSFPLTQTSVLGRLDRDGTQTASALATAESMRPQSMAQILLELETDGLISRRPDPNDRRRMLIKLTTRGRSQLRANRRRREGWLVDAIATTLTPDEQRTLVDALPLLRRLGES
ncbi:MAG TPA: MarR family transcriptional regulator [Gaiellaceae bacterium]|nr:MarR family transcriptional regulator [Gaiellaceae bacterium]